MDSDCQMFLVINDDRHRLKQGITLLGSAENDRYSVIRLDEKSICPKHAAVRCNPSTQELHVMDLCSHSGTTLTLSCASTPQDLSPLEWHAVPHGARITIGTTLQCRAEIGSLLGGSAGTAAARRSTRLGSASFFEDSTDFIDCSLEENPSLKTTRSLTVSNSVAAAEKDTSKADSFVVPATQPPKGDDSSLIKVNEKVGEVTAPQEGDLDDDDLFYIPETQECNEEGAADASQVIEPIGNTIGSGDKEDDFLCFESQDERNTGDGLFNNPYVELQSQNLLQNLDESYKERERKSIAPDRSVDSISFQGKAPTAAAEETDEDLSKLEWNETKNTSKATNNGDREGSVTPDLEFGKGSGEEPRVESVTPDLDFDRVTPQQEVVKVASTSKLSLSKKVEEPVQDRAESVTPDLDEILPNQEAFNRSLNPYELATQALVPEEEDPYELATQVMPVEQELHSNSVYDLATQVEPSKSTFKIPAAPDINVYDLATQPSTSKQSFKVPPTPEDDVYDLATQQLPQEQITKAKSLRKVNVKLTNWASSKSPNISLRANKEFKLDAFDVATQQLPGAYDLATQALPQDQVPDDDTDEENDTIPLVLPTDDAYEIATQPLVAKDSHESLEDDPEMTRNFRPPINSTCRPSMIGRQIEESKEDDLNISPSSNKENQTETVQKSKKSRTAKRLPSTQDDLLGFTEPTEEDLDDDYCLAETMPIAEPEKSKKPTIFKVPDNRSTTSSTKSSRSAAMETPSRSKPSDTDTCSFEFNTPEHPFLNMAKKETILAVSDLLKSQQPKPLDRLARKNKYIFGDSSDEDADPNEPVFKKQDSKIQVMKYDRDEPKVEPPAAVATSTSERRSARDKKKNQRYSVDGEEPSTSGRSAAPPKKKVDESVDYQPSDSKSTRSRKRKADLEDGAAPVEPKSSKSSSIAEEPAKTRGRPKRVVAELPPPAAPKVEPKQETKQDRSKRTKQESVTVSDVEEAGESSANTSTGSVDSSSSGTRKSSRVAKPKLMFTKMSPEPYKRMITRAGGSIVDMPELATILVSDRVYRTYKFLCAMARGIPIVGQPYLEEVQKRRELIDPWDYILQDAEMERRFKFNMKKSLQRASETKIFQDYSVFVTPSTKPPPEELQLIVASAGGQVIKFPSQQPKHADKVFVVSNVEDRDMWPKMREVYPTIMIISTEGLMLSVMQQCKNFRNYRLT